jgi:glycosyltransferase involved in cell wall biosynthesis
MNERSPSSPPGPRVLIAAEHASARFGGEAALALHYFRVFRQRGLPVWLVTHARTRDELSQLFPGEARIRYVEDTALHRLMYRLGQRLPPRVAFFTLGFVSRFSTQLAQRRMVRELIAAEGIEVVHQPMPVSPREPSMLFGFGVPVLIGPMNGGMDYPPGFRRRRGLAERVLFGAGKRAAGWLNRLMPGKREAALLLVANRRTLLALPQGVSPRVHELVENGVDLSLWRPGTATGEVPVRHSAGEAPAPAAPAERPVSALPTDTPAPDAASAVPTFVYMGRLVDWKSVDLLLRAFARASSKVPMRLLVIGDGVERQRLEALAASLGLVGTLVQGSVRFTGWLSQHACAQNLASADGLVLPSVLECGGAVVLEAMSMGKPVIATAWGGPLDYLDADCGVLVPPETPERLIEGFAAAMARLAASPSERESMGRAGRAKVQRDYDWEVKADRMLEMYEAARRHGHR